MNWVAFTGELVSSESDQREARTPHINDLIGGNQKWDKHCFNCTPMYRMRI
ncbi:protein of unknown function [Paenibacillus alvei]|uniref:Uncharacterized protein n=1 Tax=Paenibacillus alvei TaxID=44250 RepID=A0A383RGZ2_PAEAL|nr:protein of unknown function [Paenibacillus alvei]